jgi:non-specific serine/threonine protein kinase/serine/threonine-protein kinase
MSERDIFLAALETPPGPRRDAYLDEACGTDAGMRQRIHALLAAHAKAELFLEAPAQKMTEDGTPQDPSTRDFNPTDMIGVTIGGKYKLREKLGEGGMGKVFVAERKDHIKQHVAVKLIRPGLETKSIQARFEQERQALAIMDHPNIAKFFDGGVTDWGQPYFVMELIKGIPITKYCDQERLTVHDRLRLFAPVCEAVQHAHQKGIIHRDIKPSNILVALYDGKPVPKVIDFGVAKAVNQTLTDKSIYTEIKTIVGTLEYMAPEQAELNNLDIDTRVDIYALGVTLYELLVGTVPFSRKDFEASVLPEMLRMIREVEPQKPSTKLSHSDSLPSVAATRKLEPRKLTKLLSGDLDWIIMKCLEKERARRYETANGLLQDLQRYLADEPVSAGPPSAWYRVRKFTKRHRGKVLAASLLAASLLAGAVGTTWNMFRALRAEHSAETEAATAKAVQAFLEEDLLNQVSAEEQARARQPIDKDLKLRTALDRAADAIQKGKFENQPLVLASIELTIGRAYHALGLYDQAKPHIDRSLELRKKYLGERHPETLKSRLAQARHLVQTTNYKTAEPLLQQLVADADRTEAPSETKEDCRLMLGHARYQLRDYHGALALYEGVRDARLGRYTEDDRRTLYVTPFIAQTLNLLGDIKTSEDLFLRTLEKQRRVLGNEDPDTLITIQKLGSFYLKRFEYSKAAPYVEELVTTGKRVYPEDHLMMLAIYNDQAALFTGQGKLMEAGGAFKRLFELSTKLYGADHDSTIAFALNQAACLVFQKQFQEAEDVYLTIRPLVQKKHGTDSPMMRRIQRDLAGVCVKTNRFDDADVYFAQVLETAVPSKSISRGELFIDYMNAAKAKLRLQKPEELEKLLTEAEPLRHEASIHGYQVGAFHRLRGELGLLKNDPRSSKQSLLEAAAVLRRDRTENPKRYLEDRFAKEEQTDLKQALERWLTRHGNDEDLAKLLKDVPQ